MVKRATFLFLALVMCWSLTACGNNDAPEAVSKPENTVGIEKENAPEKDESQKAETASKPENTEKSKKDSAPETDESRKAETVSEPEKEQEAPDYEPERYETDTLSWDFDAAAGALSIHGSGPMRDYSDIPPEWEPYKDQILAVCLDDGITSVGAYAFCNYLHLAQVRLPDSVEVIGTSAFDYDWELCAITIPASLQYVGCRAFYNTLLIEPNDLIFPEGLAYIGDYAFHSALKSGGIVSLPSSLKYLGEKAFTNAYISDFLISEENPVYCTDNHAVYTGDMKELRMLAPVTGGMGEFRIPDGVERICEECFNAIQGISTVYIPASVTEITEGAFFSTFDLKEIVVDEANPNYKSENGLLLSKDGTLLLAWPDGRQGSELIIPDGVERLGEYLFYGRFGEAYTVILPQSVKEIGTMSLPGSMTSLTLPSGLEKVDDNVFYAGISLENIYYNGTEADWEKVTVGDGNTALDGKVIFTD